MTKNNQIGRRQRRGATRCTLIWKLIGTSKMKWSYSQIMSISQRYVPGYRQRYWWRRLHFAQWLPAQLLYDKEWTPIPWWSSSEHSRRVLITVKEMETIQLLRHNKISSQYHVNNTSLITPHYDYWPEDWRRCKCRCSHQTCDRLRQIFRRNCWPKRRVGIPCEQHFWLGES